jgi:hypothetical protein
MTRDELQAIDSLLRRLQERMDDLEDEVFTDTTPTIQQPVRTEDEQ